MTSLQLLKEQYKQLTSFLKQLESDCDLTRKLALLEGQEIVHFFLKQAHPVAIFYPQLSEIEKVAISSIIVIGQAKNVFSIPKHLSDTSQRLKTLLNQLVVFEEFYQDIGGIIGYHLKILELISQNQETIDLSETQKIHQAQGIVIHEDLEAADKAVISGIKSLPQMGELYPIGGAGDRLDLHDETTGLPLPTAKLNYLGQSLLTRMIKDLQAREYLYFKLFDKQLTTPIAMMTSVAKNNHHFVEQICNDNQWYHRPKESFKLFQQPLAPVITINGQWAMSDHLKLFLKPSGHGVIWKLARDEGILDWFEDQKRPKAILRQMNNPMAGTDQGILALIGLGCDKDKAFGFASCQRLVQAAEGVNVLIEKKTNDRYEYAISNIEYTELEKYNLKDVSDSPNSPYSVFPANTNILFIDFKEIQRALTRCSIPGMLINMKSDVPYIDETGTKQMIKGGRLESTMQNIADYLTDSFDRAQNIEEKLNLKTFLTYNIRRKTISVAKKTFKGGDSINESPEGCYCNLLQNNFDLLSKYCNIEMPRFPTTSEFIENGPTAHITFHPALGPLYSIIAQKIQKGVLHEKSELVLDLTELEVFNLNLKGSLIIKTQIPMGHLDSDSYLKYSNQSGKCTLINVKVENKGIDFSKKNVFWKNHMTRKEKFQIQLDENSEFYAKDVTFKGEYEISVPKNTRMIASMDSQGKVTFEQHPIEKPTWYWSYKISEENQVTLTKKNESI